jgi:hypothetical protein
MTEMEQALRADFNEAMYMVDGLKADNESLRDVLQHLVAGLEIRYAGKDLDMDPNVRRWVVRAREVLADDPC